MKNWPYAKLVVNAKHAGGPSQYEEQLISRGVNKYKMSTAALIVVVSAVTWLTTIISNKIFAYLSTLKTRGDKRSLIDKLSNKICYNKTTKRKKMENIIILKTHNRRTI